MIKLKEEIEKILLSNDVEELRKIRDENDIPNIELHPVCGAALGAALYRLNELAGKLVLPFDAECAEWFMNEYFGE